MASVYQIKYMGKDCVQISASASMLLDAMKNINEYPSSAEDTGTQDRRTIHFCQHAINKGCVEMEALQAAGVVLTIHSSGKSDAIQYYSGWDVVRVAKIASKGHAGDIDFRNEDLEGVDTYHDDGDRGGNDDFNEVSDSQHIVRSESIVNDDADTTVDLLEKYCTTGRDKQPGSDKQLDGFARVYRTSQGENIPVSEAHHYMHRDKKLWRFSAYEFGRLYTVRVMTTNDDKWYQAAIAQSPPIPIHMGRKQGRGCDRYLLQAPHPLHTSHILVARVKLGIPAFTGTPPPSDPSSQIMDTTTSQKRQRYAEFFVSNFIPWSAAHPPVLSYTTWVDHVNILEVEACLRDIREEDILPTMSEETQLKIRSDRRSRLIACGRLYDIENCTSCFKTKKEAVILLAKHRSRARAIWNEDGCIMPYDHTATASDQDKRASALIQKLRDKADRMTCTQDQATRQKDAAWASQWTLELDTALRSYLEPRTTTSSSLPRLQTIWKKAAFPTKLSLHGGMNNPRELAALLKQPIVLTDTNEWNIPTNINEWNTPINDESCSCTSYNDPFAAITEVEYLRAVDAHIQLKLPMMDAPLNPEQRNCGRDFLKVAILRKKRRLEGMPYEIINAEIRATGLTQITMMTGTYTIHDHLCHHIRVI